MAKRADWKQIKNLVKFSPRFNNLTKIPLIVIPHHAKENMVKLGKKLLTQTENENEWERINTDLHYIPKVLRKLLSTLFARLKELDTDIVMVLDCANKSTYQDKSLDSYSKIIIQDDFIEILVFETMAIPGRLFTINGIAHKKEIHFKSYVDGKEISETMLMETGNYIQAKSDMLKTIATRLSGLALFLEYNNRKNLYAVKKQTIPIKQILPPKVKKAKNKAAYLNEDLVSIVFLDALPSDKKVHQGGTHNSPRPHKRRGYYYTLKNKRYKEHPFYQQYNAMYKRPAYIGDKEKIVNGTTYTIMEPK